MEDRRIGSNILEILCGLCQPWPPFAFTVIMSSRDEKKDNHDEEGHDEELIDYPASVLGTKEQ